MKKFFIIATAISIIAGAPLVAQATPDGDLKAFRAYFQKRFPNVAFDEYVNGIYALDPERRKAWQEFEDFAPAY